MLICVVINYIFLAFDLATQEEGFYCKGSEFVYHEYGIGMDPANNNGVSFSIWDGPHDVHATLKAKCAPGYTFLIASCQIGQHLIKKVQKFLKKKNNGVARGLSLQLNKMA